MVTCNMRAHKLSHQFIQPGTHPVDDVWIKFYILWKLHSFKNLITMQFSAYHGSTTILCVYFCCDWTEIIKNVDLF